MFASVDKKEVSFLYLFAILSDPFFKLLKHVSKYI